MLMKKMLAHREVLFLLVIVILSTVLPHPDNVTPIGALGLFAGTYMRQRGFLLLPVIAALLADLTTVGVYSLLIMVFVYAGHLLSSLCGRYLVDRHKLPSRLPLGILAASFGFYLVSNIGNWWVYQPHTIAGVIECYVNGLPYLFRTLLGNAMYGLLFFGSWEFMNRRLSGDRDLARTLN
ncbi:MAG: DUF6580 family putative transport protein [Pseudohongiellaceae bacterium]